MLKAPLDVCDIFENDILVSGVTCSVLGTASVEKGSHYIVRKTPYTRWLCVMVDNHDPTALDCDSRVYLLMEDTLWPFSHAFHPGDEDWHVLKPFFDGRMSL